MRRDVLTMIAVLTAVAGCSAANLELVDLPVNRPTAQIAEWDSAGRCPADTVLLTDEDPASGAGAIPSDFIGVLVVRCDVDYSTMTKTKAIDRFTVRQWERPLTPELQTAFALPDRAFRRGEHPCAAASAGTTAIYAVDGRERAVRVLAPTQQPCAAIRDEVRALLPGPDHHPTTSSRPSSRRAEAPVELSPTPGSTECNPGHSPRRCPRPVDGPRRVEPDGRRLDLDNSSNILAGCADDRRCRRVESLLGSPCPSGPLSDIGPRFAPCDRVAGTVTHLVGQRAASGSIAPVGVQVAPARRTSIRSRLTAAVVLLVVGLVGTLTVIELIELRGYLERSVGVRVRAQAKPLIDAASARQLSQADADQLATDLSSADTGAVIVGPEGTVIARPAEGSVGRPPPTDLPAPALRAALSGALEVDVVRDGDEGRDLLVFVPVPGQRSPVVVVLVTSLARADGIVRQQALTALLGLAAVVVAAVILGPLIVRRSLRPLTEVAAAADDVAAGNLRRRLRLPGPADEIGRLAIAFDAMTTALEDAFGKLAASEARSRVFVADAGHELRTPLTSLGGYADVLLRRQGSLTDGEVRLLAGLRREVDRMGRLVDSLVLLARADSVPNHHNQQVDLAELAETAVEQARALDTGHRMDVSTDSVVVSTNPDWVMQILLNLLLNAVRHTPAGTTVTVTVARAPDGGAIEVADDGPGMDDALRERAFERFSRGPSEAEGSGLGLAIVASMTASLNGRLQLSSAPGRGTRVRVVLPISQQLQHPVSDS